ncbi:hypothetical protein [Pseudoxanthomonas sp. X-1]|uniref:hypothetical protein n=1 Tax=Pseudoxanthomonas sp. X-1 TaxID=2571115 RepID=UPI00110BFEAE|nr:hypothetical protein [Pseudoxanthomonas sp. X-1]TMN24502.1 hypothetical protein FF950_05320 [Pseudoxanthomonas sp. X-1]UAY75232.1 hypothetical protein LAJ50_02910 [Pseudoxanthomonas sp. X-1]
MTIKVKAIAEGYYGDVLRIPGTANAEFEIGSEEELGKWMEVVGGKASSDDPPPADPFLDRTVADITGDLASLTPEQLVSYRDAESKGKARKGVLEAIDAETAARSADA